MTILKRIVSTCISPLTVSSYHVTPFHVTKQRHTTSCRVTKPHEHQVTLQRCYTTNPRYLVSDIEPSKIAIKDINGSHSFEKLSQLSTTITDYIRSTCIRGARVALLLPPSLQFTASMIGVMNANCIPVPLNYKATDSELEYLLNDCEASVVLTTLETGDILSDEVTSLCLDGNEGEGVNPNVSFEDLIGGIIIYTSGTTGKPKGVLTGCGAFKQWYTALVHGWQIAHEDSILHTLPLYHVHGVLGLFSILTQGGTVDLRPRFDSEVVWNEFLSETPPSVYYGVPTQYSKLIQYYDAHLAEREDEVRKKLQRLRLMVSGSAPLRVSVSEKWEHITGHRLLERYGMTETGLTISNPYQPVSGRKPGCIGLPFHGVQVRLVDDSGEVVAEAADGELRSGSEGKPGEIQISGPTVFKEYFNNPAATAETFTPDGWFKTGDTAEISEGVFKILGRTSSDIIKSGAYKLSALEIERILMDHNDIADVAVIGIDDEMWGQKVVAVIESDLQLQEHIDKLDLRGWCKHRMSPYKVPKDFIVVEALPRNHMGKVNKEQLVSKYSDVLR